MKNFRTTILPEPSKNKINYHSPVLFMGSCFTENIGNKMLDLKFPALLNPFGVLYNPASIRSSLEVLLDKRDFNENDLFLFNDQWISFYHDTEFSNPNLEVCLQNINQRLSLARAHFLESKILVITFGTAWIYQFLETGNVVSNCHKIPAKQFDRIKLGVEDIFVEWAKLLNRIEELNPDLKIIFTVSPVRHWKDGAVQNQLSKSTLILAIHQLQRIFDNVEYFPAYEIMMDDLRDYRFYADDLLHPSKMAIEYIWEHFQQTYFEKETQDIMKEVNQIISAKNHRPLNPDTSNHKNFLKEQIQLIQNLSEKYSFLNLDSENQYFKSKL